MDEDYEENGKKLIYESLKDFYECIQKLNDNTNKVLEKLNGTENKEKFDNLVNAFMRFHAMCGGIKSMDNYMMLLLSGKENLTEPFSSNVEGNGNE